MGSRDEKADSLILAERTRVGKIFDRREGEGRHWIEVFGSNAKRRAARREHLDLWRRAQDRSDLRCCVDDLLKIVEHQQQPFVAKMPMQGLVKRLTGLLS